VALIKINNLKVHFPVRTGLFGRVKGHVRAVDNISVKIHKGETLGLVGESGSGKTTVGRTILRGIEPTDGQIFFNRNGRYIELTKIQGEELRKFRRHMQMIFQDPYASLNPRMTVRDIIAEPLVASGLDKGKTLDARVREGAARCKLNVEYLRRFPHAFSGGQRQRISIARAVVSNPEFIVCDESVSALDVSVQAEILNLLMDLQKELKTTYLFIAHDLSVVAHISHRVAVMYMGTLVELAPTENLFFSPKHPYTEALLSAIPEANPDHHMKPVGLKGEIPDIIKPPSGCRFHTRCNYARDICKDEVPGWREMEKEHFVACHFTDELVLTGAMTNSGS
jgi:oligopeptide/dipeptide ABC transporter ATP-binding protein